MPEGSLAGDWEIELGFVIGTLARKVPVDQALSHVAGYCLANDVSERDWQIKRNGQWGKGKSFDGFGPIGPWLVTSDELPDPHNIALELAVNDQIKQKSNTADMIFSVAEIVSYLNQFMTLLPGDLVITGTPEGVGLGAKPSPVFLRRGDIMTLSAGPLGTQRQRVMANVVSPLRRAQHGFFLCLGHVFLLVTRWPGDHVTSRAAKRKTKLQGDIFPINF